MNHLLASILPPDLSAPRPAPAGPVLLRGGPAEPALARPELSEQAERLDALELRILEQARRLVGADERAATQDKKLATVEKKLAARDHAILSVEEKLLTQKKRIEALEQRVARLESHEAQIAELGTRIAELAALIHSRLPTPDPIAAVESVATVAAEPPPPDDLQLIEGIGAKIAALFRRYGIVSFRQLANTDIQRMKEILVSGGKAYSAANPTLWAEQARYAADGELEKLKAFKERIRRGLVYSSGSPP